MLPLPVHLLLVNQKVEEVSSLFIIVTSWPFFSKTFSFDSHAIKLLPPTTLVVLVITNFPGLFPYFLGHLSWLTVIFVSVLILVMPVFVPTSAAQNGPCSERCYGMNCSEQFVQKVAQLRHCAVLSSAEGVFFWYQKLFDERSSMLVYIIWHKLHMVLWSGTLSNIDIEGASNILIS